MNTYMLIIFIVVALSGAVTSHADDEHQEDIIHLQEGHMSTETMSGMHNSISSSGSSLSHQIQLVLPFSHFAGGHWFAGVTLTVLWISLLYSLKGLNKK